MHRSCLPGWAGVFLACVTASALAAAPGDGRDAERARLQERVEKVLNDEALRAAALEAGRERAAFCFFCHGEDGNSRRPHIPKLAGQNPVYLLDQIEKFADGRRKTSYMQVLARRFSDEDKVNLVVYFSSLPVKPAGGDPALAVQGMKIYRTRCVGCHGEDGRGKKGYARLAGQQPEYVKKTLVGFRDHEGRRESAFMRAMVAGLSDADIEALAAYIASMD